MKQIKDRIFYQKLIPSRDAISIVLWENTSKAYWYCQIVGTELRILAKAKQIQKDWNSLYIFDTKKKNAKNPVELYDRDFIYVCTLLQKEPEYVILYVEELLYSLSGNLAPLKANMNRSS